MPTKKPRQKKASPTKRKTAVATSARPKAATRKSYQLKTTERAASVEEFIASAPSEQRRAQSLIALEMMTRLSGEPAKMWGPSIVGFGKYRYVYESGHSGEMCLTGFSPRKAAFVFYIMGGAPEADPLWARLGKYKVGKSCLYVSRFEDIDLSVLEQIIAKSLAYMREKYPN